ncbi:hypothetical protein [Marisediminicola antarctica]|uniref:Uncharacterized protein n=1 Tax=Marisediminicola antarctica TaxID=674079 RepID=A0A7L5AJS8_9MICO|nr:hypothetical protein [Marisediminicola antarctica]QHO69381.1 hypothetical protein BHD05_06720 [Marisediminicola antarctica]
MLFRRRLDQLDFVRVLAVHRVPDGPVVIAAAAGPLRSRRDGDMIVLKFDTGQYAVAVSPRALAWRWPGAAGEPCRMMLYSVSGSRTWRGELRRVAKPQRRDALYKADLAAPAS